MPNKYDIQYTCIYLSKIYPSKYEDTYVHMCSQYIKHSIICFLNCLLAINLHSILWRQQAEEILAMRLVQFNCLKRRQPSDAMSFICPRPTTCGTCINFSPGHFTQNNVASGPGPGLLALALALALV